WSSDVCSSDLNIIKFEKIISDYVSQGVVYMKGSNPFQPSCCVASRDAVAKKKKLGENEKYNQNQDVEVRFPDKLIHIPGGEYAMGTDDKEGFSYDHEGPIRKVHVKSFYIDETTVTNAEFQRFIHETHYVTDAEKYGWSFVFYKLLSEKQLSSSQQLSATPWWFAVKQAYWYQPEGPGSDITNRMEHPVIHIS